MVKPKLVNLLSAKPSPEDRSISLLLEDETHVKHEFSLTAKVANQVLAALLHKSIFPGFYKSIEVYPLRLKGVAQGSTVTGQHCLQLFFSSGLPVTIVFDDILKDIDSLISVLENLKAMVEAEKVTKH
jgi:hypothetical protein